MFRFSVVELSLPMSADQHVATVIYERVCLFKVEMRLFFSPILSIIYAIRLTDSIFNAESLNESTHRILNG